MLITKKLKNFKCIKLISLYLVLLSTSQAYNFTQVNVSNQQTANDEDRIAVFASASLNPILTQIIQTYSTQQNANVVLIYTASAPSVKQLENGVPIDLFISDKPEDMKALMDINWIKNAKNLWGNRLVLVSTPEYDNVFVNGWRRSLIVRNEEAHSKEDLSNIQVPNANDTFNVNELSSWQNKLNASHTKGTKRLGLADPLFSGLGNYTQEMLNQLPFSAEINQHSLYFFDESVLIGQLESHDIDYAILYYTDALKFFEKEIIALIPDNFHSAIIYSLGQVNKPQSDAKQAKIDGLVKYLSDSSTSLKMLENGFLLSPNLIAQPSISVPVLGEGDAVNIESKNNTLKTDILSVDMTDPLLIESNLLKQIETIQLDVEPQKE